jgi:alginate O-acetyltransferase complex protein AlgJ
MQTRPAGDQPLPSGGRAREDLARLELEHTTASPAVVRLLTGFFLLAIAAVPVAEWTAIRAGRAPDMASAWSSLFSLPRQIRTDMLPATGSTAPGRWQSLAAGNRIAMGAMATFERALEDEALIARALRRPTQVWMTRSLGAGNERVYPGRDGWLFYRPDVEYVTGRGFLDRAAARQRIAAAPQWAIPPHPDPRPAIVRFARDLQSRGITLIVLPTPHKPGVHPEMLGRRGGDDGGILQNVSYAAFVDDLRRHGVLVFDPSDELAGLRRSGPQYLATDTHWRPEAMEAVVDGLVEFIAAHAPLPAVAAPDFRLERLEVRNVGDTARMLDLPEGSPLVAPEAAWIRRVLQRDGSLWRSSREADVLVLGDSFSNIYTLESMAWGTSAGFVEQLSYALGRPIDRLVQNDAGAWATRDMLARDPDRLATKKVVVYQFGARELSFGDWKILPIPPAPTAAP